MWWRLEAWRARRAAARVEALAAAYPPLAGELADGLRDLLRPQPSERDQEYNAAGDASDHFPPRWQG